MTLGEISALQVEDVPGYGRFWALGVDGYVPTGEIGRPALPTHVEIIEIPQGATPVVEILRDRVEIVELPESDGEILPLYPMQAPVSKGSRPAPAFAYDRQAYAVKGYPAHEPVRVEIMGESRGVRLARIIVMPVEYDAARNRLRVHTELNFEVVFEGADYDATQARKQRYRSREFRVPESISVNAAAMRMDTRASKAVKVEEQPLRYAVVADEKFKDSLQGFLAWKRQQGYEVIEAYTSDARVGNTAESIRAYLKKLYDNASEANPAPTYVLLVGDTKEIPPFESRYRPGYNGHITDLYFVEYTGDTLPDAYLGRFSASTVEDLMPQIYKTMYMSRIDEKAAGFTDTVLLVAGNDSRYNVSHLNPALRYVNAYVEQDGPAVPFLYLAPASSTGEKEDEIIARVSAGAGMICYTGHGLEYEWCEPNISNSVLRSKIFNKDKYPMMIGNCCLTGAFDYKAEPCFGEQLLRTADKGAVVYIGATNSSYFDEDFYWMVGVTEIDTKGQKEYTYDNTGKGASDYFYHTHGEAYDDWAVTASDLIFKGNMSVEESYSILRLYYWEIYELFGDPSYRPYKHRPQPLPIECETDLTVGSSSLDVLTEPFAQLALYGTEGIIAVVSADAHGRAELPTTAVQVGTYHLYGGASGYADNEIVINAKEPEGKFMFAESVEVFDGDLAVDMVQYGKRYGLSLKMKNIGKEEIGTIKVQLVSDDPYWTSEDIYTYAETSRPGEFVELDKKLFFSISPDVPNNHLIRYRVVMTLDDEEKPVTRVFRVMVLASDLHLVAMTIDDAETANPNGVLDAGESVKISLRLCNDGAADARNVKASFTTEKPYLVLPDAGADWGTIKAGDTVWREFWLGADKGEFRYDLYTVVCGMNADGREQNVEVTSYIGPVIETFESGDFNFVAWDTVSDWEISDSAYQGRYCAASARISDRDTSRLRIKVNVLLDDEVGFYYRTSTEGVSANVGDFLVFVIDGVMQGRWNRETPWTYATYPVSAGEHTLEWWYVKDASESGGGPCVD